MKKKNIMNKIKKILMKKAEKITLEEIFISILFLSHKYIGKKKILKILCRMKFKIFHNYSA